NLSAAGERAVRRPVGRRTAGSHACRSVAIRHSGAMRARLVRATGDYCAGGLAAGLGPISVPRPDGGAPRLWRARLGLPRGNRDLEVAPALMWEVDGAVDSPLHIMWMGVGRAFRPRSYIPQFMHIQVS